MTDRHARSFGFATMALVPIVAVLFLWVRAGRAPAARATALEAAITEVEAGRRTTPLVGERAATGEYRVTFLAKSPDGEVPRVVSDVTGWGENVRDDTFDFTIGRMTRVGSTRWYSLETLVVPGARIEYLIVHGRDYRVDPWNPRHTRTRAGAPNSEFTTPGHAPAPDPSQLPALARGTTSEGRIVSRAVGGRDAQHRTEAAPAAPEIESVVSPRLLDHLIGAGAIEPLVVAFVESSPWGGAKSYPREATRTFLSREVPDWVAAHYEVSSAVEKRAILGRSAGARKVTEAALGSPAFGRIGLLIPGRRVALEPELEGPIAASGRRLHVAILAGRYDLANLATAVSLRRAFEGAGARVAYIEVAEGHNQTTWQDHAAKVLVALFKPAD